LSVYRVSAEGFHTLNKLSLITQHMYTLMYFNCLRYRFSKHNHIRRGKPDGELFLGSTGKRVPQCYNHHSVVHQIAFARRLAYFFCLSKRSMEKKTPDDAGPTGFPVLLASGGTPKTR
jgi:hypothetical protein